MADNQPSELLLTYPELAARLGVSADGARTRAKRQGWPVILGNDGRARVRVLASDMPERPPVRPEQTGEETDLLAELRRSHAERAAELRALLDRASGEAERWRSEHGQARAEGERHKAAAELLREQLARELSRADRLEAALAEARRPWLARVLEGLRRKGS